MNALDTYAQLDDSSQWHIELLVRCELARSSDERVRLMLASRMVPSVIACAAATPLVNDLARTLRCA